MTSPIHPDSGPIVCYVSHRRSKDVEGCTIGISISLLALMADSRDRRTRAIKSNIEQGKRSLQDNAVRPVRPSGYCFPFIVPLRVLAPHSVVISIKILQLLIWGPCDPSSALQCRLG
jgi:hypothetical protein